MSNGVFFFSEKEMNIVKECPPPHNRTISSRIPLGHGYLSRKCCVLSEVSVNDPSLS